MTAHSRSPRSQIGLRTPVFVAAFIALLFTAPGHAQKIRYDADPAQSRVEFTLDAFIHTVHGTMMLTQGHMDFDRATGAASGRFVVDSRSAGTGSGGRDKKMHESVLESMKFPEIAFTPQGLDGEVPLSGKGTVQLRGVISIHGTEQEIKTPVTLDINDTRWVGDTEFPVPYSMWGLKNPSTLFLRVKDTVMLRIHLVGGFPPAER